MSDQNTIEQPAIAVPVFWAESPDTAEAALLWPTPGGWNVVAVKGFRLPDPQGSTPAAPLADRRACEKWLAEAGFPFDTVRWHTEAGLTGPTAAWLLGVIAGRG